MGTLLRRAFGICHVTPDSVLGPCTEDGHKSMSDREVTSRIIEVVSAERCVRGFVLEGFPQTASQAAKLDAVLESRKLPLDHVFHLGVTTETGQKRLATRLVHPASGRRYNTETMPSRAGDTKDEVTMEDLSCYVWDKPEKIEKRQEKYGDTGVKMKEYFEEKRSPKFKNQAAYIPLVADGSIQDIFAAISQIARLPRAP
eukprot:CAMPEP_0204434412 /NCGR_PEP_ID=MMETSP0470-20130426/71473_1 /ASSEMBLY_ACC=CAM_ASM_000385 /TAXON_ID=2969 /ORGANISM="Oxyrrhis marina" /LENGTH=199 /DNA_ID=CAMNT_0051432897 /DNA_START=84 /DNA_END=683 /DNA_ORIENTATION=-